MRSGLPWMSRDALAPLGARGKLPLQRGPQEQQVPVALDPAQARLNGPQRTGHPARLLVGAAPPIDLGGVRPGLRVERLQAVGGLQADTEGPTQAQPRVRVSSRPSSRLLTADSLTSVNVLRSRRRAAVASA
jgi:hypothetical protein